MNLCAITDNNTSSAQIAESYEIGKQILVVDSETMSVIYAGANDNNPDTILKILTDFQCEAVITGPIKSPDIFDVIAGNHVTRYNGVRFNLYEAVDLSVKNLLPLITDYVGGSGCNE